MKLMCAFVISELLTYNDYVKIKNDITKYKNKLKLNRTPVHTSCPTRNRSVYETVRAMIENRC